MSPSRDCEACSSVSLKVKVLGEVYAGEHCVQEVDGSLDDTQGADGNTHLLLTAQSHVLVFGLVAGPVVQRHTSHRYKHHCTHKVHYDVLKHTFRIEHLEVV